MGGPVPAELGYPPNLWEILLRGNGLTGCIPAGLMGILSNDFEELGLDFCEEIFLGVPCVGARAVSEYPDNPGLLSDCEVLLGVRDTLAGTADLNWSVDVSIAEWEGVRVGGDPKRVTGLDPGPRRRVLTGRIPGELSQLTALTVLELPHQRLSGPIPPELGNLTNLEILFINGNQLIGPIPPELGGLEKLKLLALSRNQLSGPIPPELGQLNNLTLMWLYDNQLRGPIPPELNQSQGGMYI